MKAGLKDLQAIPIYFERNASRYLEDEKRKSDIKCGV
jgi:hypothetical protein